MKLIDIHSPQDIKPLTIDDLKDLAKQMRAAIINYTSTIGGHVGPNLGDVEALIGVHYVFDAPKDKIVIDVSHQDFVLDILLVINDKDSIPPLQRPWPSAAVDRFRVPADSGLTAPLIAQANRACPALNIFIAPTSSALER